jgi:hypothetical protein
MSHQDKTYAELLAQDDPHAGMRYLNWKLKQAHRQIGKQGDTIHHLRGELAEVRLLNSRVDRGDLRAYDRLSRLDNERISELVNENRVLREKLEGA